MAFYDPYDKVTKDLLALLKAGKVDAILAFMRENAEDIEMDQIIGELTKKKGSLLRRLLEGGLDPMMPIGQEHLTFYHLFILNYDPDGAFRPTNLLEWLNLFLRHGADINHQDTYHRTLLHLLYDNIMDMQTAAGRGFLKKLLALGADLDLQDELGLTPVHSMIQSAVDTPSLIETLEIAMAHGFNPLLESNEGLTVRGLAERELEEVEGDYQEVLMILEDYETMWLDQHPENRMSGRNMLNASQGAHRGGRRVRTRKGRSGRKSRAGRKRQTRRQ